MVRRNRGYPGIRERITERSVRAFDGRIASAPGLVSGAGAGKNTGARQFGAFFDCTGAVRYTACLTGIGSQRAGRYIFFLLRYN